METFGERLSRLRKERNLTQGELAQRLNISKSSIGMYEIDQREPNFETLELLSNYFGVTIDYLILGKTTNDNDK